MAGLGASQRSRRTRARTEIARPRALVPWVVPALVLVTGAVAYYLLYHLGSAGGTPVRSDGEGYYAYLPSFLLYHDDSFIAIVNGHLRPAYPGISPSVFGFSLQGTGHWLDKYPVGEAMLLTPFFVVGHTIAAVGGANADGYSSAEVYTAGLGGLAYTALGLAALGAAMRRWFSPGIIAATLFIVTFGTPVFHYATFDAIFSHAFSFFAVAAALLCALRWYDRPSSRSRALLVGLACGAVVAVRYTNVVLLLAMPLLGVGSVAALRSRLHLLRENRSRLGLILLAGAATLVPQVVTWYLATRHLMVRPYAGESFDFAHPHLLESLFSFDPHGLLPYAPVMVFAFVGLGFSWFARRDLAVPVTVAFLPFWYLVSSWWDWSFSAGYGNRAFNDVMPLLALPLAVLLARCRGRVVRPAVAVACAFLVGVTSVQMVHYWQGRIGGSGIDAAGYFQQLARL